MTRAAVLTGSAGALVHILAALVSRPARITDALVGIAVDLTAPIDAGVVQTGGPGGGYAPAGAYTVTSVPLVTGADTPIGYT